MNTIITTEKAIRFVANNNFGYWVVNRTETGQITVACFYLPVVNEHYTFREDGLRIEIERFPKGDYLLNGYYVEPFREMEKTIRISREKSYDEAFAAGQEFIKEILDLHKEILIKYYPALYGPVEEQIEMVF